MTISKYTFKNVNLKFNREGRGAGRMKERERQHTISQDVTISTSFSSLESTKC